MEEQVLKDIESTNIESTDNISYKYDNLLEYYKSISLKLILACEQSIYKISEKNNLLDNLKSKCSIQQIDDLLHPLITTMFEGIIDENIEHLIVDIMELDSKIERVQIINTTYWIIYNFYEIKDRKKFDISDIEKYQTSIIVTYKSFVKENYNEIIQVIADYNFNFDTDYHLDIE